MKRLIIYTSYFPFTEMSEAFLLPELIIGIRNNISITVIPVNRTKYRRKVPEGLLVDESLCSLSLLERIKSLILIPRYVRFFCKSDIYGIVKPRYLFDCIKYLYASNLVYHDLKNRTSEIVDNETVFYSYWLSYAPIAFSLYKYNNPRTPFKFIARGHGSDVYGKAIGVYCPLRGFVINSLDAIFTISHYGRNFLLAQYPMNKTPIIVSHLGVNNNKRTIAQDNIIRIVSCSNVIQLKRVDHIFKSIYLYAKSNPHQTIEWTHIGSGPLLDKVRNDTIKNQLNNLKCCFLGSMDNTDILKLYKKKYFYAFILLSKSEGIPVSIMEAISSAIPIIATNVGGVPEIVNKSTGILLNSEFEQSDFDNALRYVIENNRVLSESAYGFYKKSYNAKRNFNVFFEQINNI